MKQIKRILLLTTTAIMLTACSTKKTETQQQTNTIEQQKQENLKEAFNFTAYDINNKEVKLSDFKGKKVYINMWASWCGPCIHEIPELEKTYQNLKKRDDIVFLSITSPKDEIFKNSNAKDESKDTILKKAKELGVNYPVLFDVNDRFIINYSIRAFPTHIFINSDGTINKQVPGMMTEKSLLNNIEQLK